MAKDPAFLFYTQDFITGVFSLTMEERGQYITLLCMQHQKGRLTQRDFDIVGKISPELLEKFQSDDKGYFNSRLEVEVARRKEYSKKREEILQKARDKKKEIHDKTPIDSSINRTMDNSINRTIDNPTNRPIAENENENENIFLNKEGVENFEAVVWPSFDDFWNAYDYKVKRTDAEKAWRKVKQAERERIMQHLELYIPNSFKSGGYPTRMHPTTYLNKQSWNDEVITARPEGSAKPDFAETRLASVTEMLERQKAKYNPT